MSLSSNKLSSNKVGKSSLVSLFILMFLMLTLSGVVFGTCTELTEKPSGLSKLYDVSVNKNTEVSSSSDNTYKYLFDGHSLKITKDSSTETHNLSNSSGYFSCASLDEKRVFSYTNTSTGTNIGVWIKQEQQAPTGKCAELPSDWWKAYTNCPELGSDTYLVRILYDSDYSAEHYIRRDKMQNETYTYQIANGNYFNDSDGNYFCSSIRAEEDYGINNEENTYDGIHYLWEEEAGNIKVGDEIVCDNVLKVDGRKWYSFEYGTKEYVMYLENSSYDEFVFFKPIPGAGQAPVGGSGQLSQPVVTPCAMVDITIAGACDMSGFRKGYSYTLEANGEKLVPTNDYKVSRSGTSVSIDVIAQGKTDCTNVDIGSENKKAIAFQNSKGEARYLSFADATNFNICIPKTQSAGQQPSGGQAGAQGASGSSASDCACKISDAAQTLIKCNVENTEWKNQIDNAAWSWRCYKGYLLGRSNCGNGRSDAGTVYITYPNKVGSDDAGFPMYNKLPSEVKHDASMVTDVTEASKPSNATGNGYNSGAKIAKTDAIVNPLKDICTSGSAQAAQVDTTKKASLWYWATAVLYRDMNAKAEIKDYETFFGPYPTAPQLMCAKIDQPTGIVSSGVNNFTVTSTPVKKEDLYYLFKLENVYMKVDGLFENVRLYDGWNKCLIKINDKEEIRFVSIVNGVVNVHKSGTPLIKKTGTVSASLVSCQAVTNFTGEQTNILEAYTLTTTNKVVAEDVVMTKGQYGISFSGTNFIVNFKSRNYKLPMPATETSLKYKCVILGNTRNFELTKSGANVTVKITMPKIVPSVDAQQTIAIYDPNEEICIMGPIPNGSTCEFENNICKIVGDDCILDTINSSPQETKLIGHGEVCENDNQCASGVCIYSMPSSGKRNCLYDKFGNGLSCKEAHDCKSNNCSENRCAAAAGAEAGADSEKYNVNWYNLAAHVAVSGEKNYDLVCQKKSDDSIVCYNECPNLNSTENPDCVNSLVSHFVANEIHASPCAFISTDVDIKLGPSIAKMCELSGEIYIQFGSTNYKLN